MDGEDESGGLFNIEFDSEDEKAAAEQENKVPRDFQSEEDFQEQVREWAPKVETGEVCTCRTAFPLQRPSIHLVRRRENNINS